MEKIEIILYALSNLYDIMSIKIKKLKINALFNKNVAAIITFLF